MKAISGGRPWPITTRAEDEHANSTQGWKSNARSFLASILTCQALRTSSSSPRKKESMSFFFLLLSFCGSYSCPRCLARWQTYSSAREALRLFQKTEAARRPFHSRASRTSYEKKKNVHLILMQEAQNCGSGSIGGSKTIIYLQTLTVIPALEINLMNDSQREAHKWKKKIWFLWDQSNAAQQRVQDSRRHRRVFAINNLMKKMNSATSIIHYAEDT